MSEKLRDGVTEVGYLALEIMDKYLKGENIDEGRLRQAGRMIGFGVKIEHMNQTRELQNKSLALRLVRLLPQDEALRQRYIEITNPEVKQLLLGRPTDGLKTE